MLPADPPEPAPPTRLGPVVTLNDHVSASEPAGPLSADLRRALVWSTWRDNANSYGVFGTLGAAIFVTYLSNYRYASGSVAIGYIAAAVTVYYLIITVRQALALRRDFAAGEARQADGVVSLQRGRLLVTYPGEAPVTLKHFGVPPGRYRFYYLPQSQCYLAFQPILPVEAPPPPAPEFAPPRTSSARLERIFRFTAADLNENRVGRRSRGQIGRARWALVRLVALYLALAGLLTWLFIAFGAWALVWWLLLLTSLFLVVDGRPRLQDLRQAAVQRLEGAVAALTTTSGLSSQDIILVAGKSLPIPIAALHEIHVGDFYRVYVVPLTNEILSLERIEAHVESHVP